MEQGHRVPNEYPVPNGGEGSPEIVEIKEESRDNIGGSCSKDVYIAVGKDDLDVVKWALDHVTCPGARVFLVHVFPPLTYIRTPVGKLSRNQLSKEQLRVYLNEENNKRKNLLQKYISLCNDSKVTVDTMLLESNKTSRAILELIPVLNISNLVLGTKHPHFSKKRRGRGEYIKENAPEYCEVTIVPFGGKITGDDKQVTKPIRSSQNSNNQRQKGNGRHTFGITWQGKHFSNRYYENRTRL